MIDQKEVYLGLYVPFTRTTDLHQIRSPDTTLNNSTNFFVYNPVVKNF